MPNGLKQLRDYLIRALEGAVATVMGILVLDVTWQVFSRYVLNHPSSWSEELATILMIWVALLGASVGFHRKSHLGVDYFIGKLPDRPRAVVEAFVYAIVAFFALSILLYGGSRLVYLTLITNQLTPALGLKRGYVYLALPISGFFIGMFSIERLIESLASIGRGAAFKQREE